MELGAAISFTLPALLKLAPHAEGQLPFLLVAIALLFLSLVFFALVIAARIWFAMNRGRSKSSRCCLHCGYDLRLTPSPIGPTASRCPECGQANPFCTPPIPH